jgi:hypothetical protein
MLPVQAHAAPSGSIKSRTRKKRKGNRPIVVPETDNVIAAKAEAEHERQERPIARNENEETPNIILDPFSWMDKGSFLRVLRIFRFSSSSWLIRARSSSILRMSSSLAASARFFSCCIAATIGAVIVVYSIDRFPSGSLPTMAG